MASLRVFPDNTALINFALVRRMDLLATILGNRATWCSTVAWECHQSSLIPGLEDLAKAPAIFREPLRPESPTEHLLLRTIRERLASPGEDANRHLGESETLAIISDRLLQPSIFVTDDVGVTLIASDYQVKTITTWDLLRNAHRGSHLTDTELWQILRDLRVAKRGGPPGVRDLATMRLWLRL